MTDQAGAIPMWVPVGITFASTTAQWVSLHKSAGFRTAQDVAAYFQAGSDGRNVSAHYVVGLDGTIVQCVPESRGAGANCCTEAGHAAFLPDADGSNVNLNVMTISIEHVDPTTDNSTPVPSAQYEASLRLIHDICVRHNIPMRPGDASGGIITHAQIDPISRARCPGNYPLDQLFADLQGGGTVGVPHVPTGWKDDGTILTAPNGVTVRAGFRDYVLNNNWDSGDWPIQGEQGRTPVEDSNPSLGGGTWQPFRTTILEWTNSRGVFVSWGGQELVKARQELTDAQNQITVLQAQLAAAKKIPVPAPIPAPNVKAAVDQAIALLKPLA